MLLDSGVLTVCALEDAAPPGTLPEGRLAAKGEHWYGERTVGYGRYFAARQANERIGMLVRIQEDRGISANDYCLLENGDQYRIAQVQHIVDSDGLRMTELSLERLGTFYEVG